jgi:hypothetical protein
LGMGDRGLHHYATPLNAVPLMMHYRSAPRGGLHLLRMATAGGMEWDLDGVRIG